ncbi:putative eukaryotic translation initiation factor 5A [Rosellinia necatrix]|uniref:Eukaryotic translation initiation factor 5A n=1 Tax=Rosellinia necatrix TaxID=77044 RepID=A0A1S7UIB7_ROSNE|nr:putative eukaryotic translation initiation factor 5A [Rosellinia necatrix]
MADEEHNHDFTEASAGASLTYPMQCSALRKNQHVVIKGRPCKIVDMSTSKTGKHGHAKVHLVGIDIFTDKKMEELCPSTHNMDVPNIKSSPYEVLGITDDDFLYLMDGTGNQSEDIKLPGSELGETIKNNLSLIDDGKITLVVTVTEAMGETHVTKVDAQAPRS